MAEDPKPNFLTCPVPERSLPAAPAQNALEEAIPPVRPTHAPQQRPPSIFDEPPPARPKKRRGIGRAIWITFTAIVLVLVVAAPAIYGLARAAQAGTVAKSSLERAVAHMETRELSQASTELDRAHGALADTRDALQGMGFWRDIPSIGTQVRALEDAASAGVSTVDALRDLLGVAEDLLDAAATVDVLTGELVNPVEGHRSFNDLTPEEKRSMLARLSRALPDIRAAQAKVSVALDTWNSIPQESLYAPIKTAFQPIAENLPKLKTALDEAVPLLEIMLPLAGYPEPTHYLVVLQNTDEIRATGGFLGTWGVIGMDGGDIQRFEFDDVYALDNPASGNWTETPPQPIAERLGVPAWYFRDSNWSPDFPTSAQRMSDFYVRETFAGTGETVPTPDAVIALNAPIFEDLLRLVGPITVDGVTFTADNFFDTLEYEVEINFLEKGIPISERKGILIKVGDELLRRLTSLPASQWPTLLDILTRGLDRKQVQIYARNQSLMARLDAFGWTGRAKPTQDDFLWVIDSNLAALKTDGVMEKHIDYTVDATAPNGPVATVTLRYTNHAPGFQEFRYTRYRDYVRIYVPEGAELIDVQGAMADDRYRTGGRPVPGRVDVYKELGKTVFGAFWSIEPTATQELTFTYRLPPSTLDALDETGYRLDVPKQSGNDATVLSVDLRFNRPVRGAIPGEDPSQFGDTNYYFETDMEFDRAFQVQF